MKFTILTVGRIKKGPEKNLCDLYLKRIKWSVLIEEVEEKRSLPINQMKTKESELLLKKLPEDCFLVALDQSGQEFSSKEFSEQILKWQSQYVKQLVILIGGSNGFNSNVLEQADLKIAFGRMTWPHMFTRIMLLEQLYRAQSILDGHPYHK
ncbi:MAG: 23S rRNA (pseudouridine(1915)-N(3))-methyltransferase RlmH [Pseudomonadota bacterium]|nr:23S rRNA (pseudouridine(1915)-N(3))-methyltransferase RlmH [Pseudomonadota bacterium]